MLREASSAIAAQETGFGYRPASTADLIPINWTAHAENHSAADNQERARLGDALSLPCEPRDQGRLELSSSAGSDGLTPDNLHLSGPIMGDGGAAAALAIRRSDILSATAHRVDRRIGANIERLANLIAGSIADNTRRAYASDLAHFEAWGGAVPAAPSIVASYLAAYADTLSVATLVRRIATISKAHEAKGLPNPCRSEMVRATLRGIRRLRGTAQRQAKPLLRDDLFQVLDMLGDGPKDVRDRALLLLGFAGGFRRSELVGLDRSDVETVRQGLIVILRHSKTDQEGAGRKVGIPYGRTQHCPVAALDAWLTLAGIEAGPIFRTVDRHGYIHSDRLSGDAVSLVIRERVSAAGIDAGGFSAHSLRAGFATSAAQAGVSTIKIRAQTGHASDAMLASYIRDGELFRGNAADVLL